MATKILEAPDAPTYDTDVAAWAAHQAALLRQRRADAVDWMNIAEEIESLGNEQEHAVESHLVRIIEHLLKLDHSPDVDPRRSWRLSVSAQRAQLRRRLRKNPSLRARLNEFVVESWREGVIEATRGLRPEEADALPGTPCYAPAQLLDDTYFGEREATA